MKSRNNSVVLYNKLIRLNERTTKIEITADATLAKATKTKAMQNFIFRDGRMGRAVIDQKTAISRRILNRDIGHFIGRNIGMNRIQDTL